MRPTLFIHLFPLRTMAFRNLSRADAWSQMLQQGRCYTSPIGRGRAEGAGEGLRSIERPAALTRSHRTMLRIAGSDRPLPTGEVNRTCGTTNSIKKRQQAHRKCTVATRCAHAEATERSRLRSSWVRGLSTHANRSEVSIISRTPSRFSYTSVFETRSRRKPQASRASVRAVSRSISDGLECVTPSTSMISFPSSVTKSTTYRSSGCWRRNFHRASCLLRSACHSFASVLVCDARSFRALALNLSILLTLLHRTMLRIASLGTFLLSNCPRGEGMMIRLCRRSICASKSGEGLRSHEKPRPSPGAARRPLPMGEVKEGYPSVHLSPSGPRRASLALRARLLPPMRSIVRCSRVRGLSTQPISPQRGEV